MRSHILLDIVISIYNYLNKEIVNRMKKRVIALKEGRLVKDLEKGGYCNEAI